MPSKKKALKDATKKVKTTALEEKATKTSKATSKSKVATKTKKTKEKVTKAVAKTSTKTTKKATKTTTTRKKAVKRAVSTEDVLNTEETLKNISLLEHYDLPYRYNQTVVKVLAQTPNRLFVYWDVTDDSIEKFKEEFGPDFLNYTKPVLIVHNNTMNYSFEVEVDDFANGWYIEVSDANCNYTVELGRRAKFYNEERHIDIPNNYLYISSSNEMPAPNDHVLLDSDISTVYFKNLKTNAVTSEKISSGSFIRSLKKIYDLCSFSEEELASAFGNNFKLDLKNPSSGNPSSTFK